MREAIKTYLQPAFLICVVILTAAGSGMSIAIKQFGVYLKKEPLPLRKSLELLDEDGLTGYKVLSKQKIENQYIVKELGTQDYIQWILEDSEAAADSPVGKFLLFITYYQLPDRVPHVPEECYTGGGYQRLISEAVTFDVRESDFNRKIPGKYLVFVRADTNLWQRGDKFPVLYFFNVNGVYASSREEARLVLNKNLFQKSAYFCKIELVFNRQPAAPTKKDLVAASQKLLSVILPLLEKKHWPEWEK